MDLQHLSWLENSSPIQPILFCENKIRLFECFHCKNICWLCWYKLGERYLQLFVSKTYFFKNGVLNNGHTQILFHYCQIFPPRFDVLEFELYVNFPQTSLCNRRSTEVTNCIWNTYLSFGFCLVWCSNKFKYSPLILLLNAFRWLLYLLLR